MYKLQLFDAPDAIEPIEARLLREGTIRLGRDPGSDWRIADPECTLSRAHCELTAGDAGLTLRALGANGVFDDRSGERFPDGADTPVSLPAALRMGRFRLVATEALYVDEAGDQERTIIGAPPLGRSCAPPSDWRDAAPPQGSGSGSLLEAFCEGAGLDASLLTSDDPAEVMRRAGGIYRQLVLGIADLMTERDRARARRHLNRTTIGSADNNPFKWAPSQRLAIDLLLESRPGFLSGADAVRASFADVKRHLAATFAGLHASLRGAIETFSPEAVETAAARRGGLLKSRAAAQLEELAERRARLVEELEGRAAGALDRAFVAGYDAAHVRSGDGGPGGA